MIQRTLDERGGDLFIRVGIHMVYRDGEPVSTNLVFISLLGTTRLVYKIGR